MITTPGQPVSLLGNQQKIGEAGRYAPSPTGDLHLGNLRTAVLAWILARQTGRRFLLRVEDIDIARAGSADGQIADLQKIGIDWDGNVIYQTGRLHIYQTAVAKLKDEGRVYECYCSRKDILAAPSAPHSAPGSYPGTCRNLSEGERAIRREEFFARQGAKIIRQPALRLRAQVNTYEVKDQFVGQYCGTVDDFVLQRGDGVYAYNLAAVVDDALQGVTQVCRGADLLSSAPRQAYLTSLLGYDPPIYAHVPLVLGPTGQRLAKRDGAVSLRQICMQEGEYGGIRWILKWIAGTLGIELESLAQQRISAESESLALITGNFKALKKQEIEAGSYTRPLIELLKLEFDSEKLGTCYREPVRFFPRAL